jgi:hypothetical protein
MFQLSLDKEHSLAIISGAEQKKKNRKRKRDNDCDVNDEAVKVMIVL